MAGKRKLKALLQNHTAKAKEAELQALKEARQKQQTRQQKLGPKSRKHAPAAAAGSSAPPTWVPFTENDNVILIGEGDFSFAVACLDENLANAVCATSLDTKAEAEEKYAEAKTHLDHLGEDERARVLHGVDCTNLTKCKPLGEFMKTPVLEDGRQVFVFNFPHLGNSVADQDRNIRQHQKLLVEFFAQVRAVAPAAACAITLFEGEPYASWDVKPLARSQGWKLERSGRFAWAKFPGYAHRLTAKDGRTNKQQHERSARTFLFTQEK